MPTLPHLNLDLIDVRNVGLLSVPPIAAALVGTLALQADEGAIKLQRMPSHVPRDSRLYLALNCSSVAPIGCAAYMVWKHGGFNFNDTRCAMALLGGTCLSGFAIFPAMKLANLNAVAVASGLLSSFAVATSIAFGRIDKTAGCLMLPLAAWSAYCAINAALIVNANAKEGA